MEVNNFNIIKEKILKFDTNDDYYLIQIIERRKENPEMETNCRQLKSYVVNSMEGYEFYKDEIMKMCKVFNARAYINPNRKSLKKTNMELLKNLINRIVSDEYQGSHNDWVSASGKIGTNYEKMWVVDVDLKDENIYKKIIEIIEGCLPVAEHRKFITMLPTINGCHLICRPFNMIQFQDGLRSSDIQNPFGQIEVKKNNPTLLYYCDKN